MILFSNRKLIFKIMQGAVDLIAMRKKGSQNNKNGSTWGTICLSVTRLPLQSYFGSTPQIGTKTAPQGELSYGQRKSPPSGAILAPFLLSAPLRPLVMSQSCVTFTFMYVFPPVLLSTVAYFDLQHANKMISSFSYLAPS